MGELATTRDMAGRFAPRLLDTDDRDRAWVVAASPLAFLIDT